MGTSDPEWWRTVPTQRGQALSEFALLALLATGLIGAAVRWQLAEWKKLRCLHRAFEQAHARLADAPPGVPVVVGEAICGASRERVSLRTLGSFDRAEEL